MTLRCTIEIVPRGDESKKKTIRVLDIHNIGRSNEDPDLYYYRVVSEGEHLFNVLHQRADGAEKLVSIVTDEYYKESVLRK